MAMNTTALIVGLALLSQTTADEAELKKILHPFYVREASSYEVYRDPDRQERLTLREQPVLTWTNSENYMGAVFVWQFQGRPELIGCIGSHQYKPDRSNVFHELHSLS